MLRPSASCAVESFKQLNASLQQRVHITAFHELKRRQLRGDNSTIQECNDMLSSIMLRRRTRCAQDELRSRRLSPCELRLHPMTNLVNRLAVHSADLANRLRANLWGNCRAHFQVPTVRVTRAHHASIVDAATHCINCLSWHV